MQAVPNSSGGGSDNLSQYSAPSAAVTPVVTPTAAATGPLSTSTSFSNPNSSTSLAAGQTLDVFFNSAVTIGSTWSIEIADTAGDIGLVDQANSTAITASGGLEVIVEIGTVGTSTSLPPTVVHTALPVVADTPWEILSASGFTGSSGAAYNVEGSGTVSPTETNTSTVTREINPSGSADSNAALGTAPSVTLNGSSSTVGTPNTFTSTCTAANDYINFYTAAGALVGSVECTATGATTYSAPTGVTFTSGDTYLFTVSAAAAPVYNSAETQTAAVIAS